MFSRWRCGLSPAMKYILEPFQAWDWVNTNLIVLLIAYTRIYKSKLLLVYNHLNGIITRDPTFFNFKSDFSHALYPYKSFKQCDIRIITPRSIIFSEFNHGYSLGWGLLILQDLFLRVHTFIKFKNYFFKLPKYETSILLKRKTFSVI